MSRTASVDDIMANARHSALVEAELAAGGGTTNHMPTGLFENTEAHHRMWSVAHAAGVMAACRAIRKLHAPKDECDNV